MLSVFPPAAPPKRRGMVFWMSLCACALLPFLPASPCLAAHATNVPPPENGSLSPGNDIPAQAPALSGFTAVRVSRETNEAQHIIALWQDVLSRHIPEKAFGNDTGILSPPVLTQWKNLSKLMPVWTSEKKLQNINGFFNRWDSKSDQDNYATEEYWATPEEFLEKGGDCEDFAIAKYLALRGFGWPERDLWLLLLTENKSGEHHAALAAKTGEKTFILDNLSRPVYLLIPEKHYVQNFTPLHAINGLGVWKLSRPPSGGE